jgi:hypothetical protein
MPISGAETYTRGMKIRCRAFALLVTLLSALSLVPDSVVPTRLANASTLGKTVAAPAGSPAALQNGRFVDASGQPVFLLGANYEGPVDRAWQMWDEGKFDPGLIAADFDRARTANLSVLRVFVQQSLANDIQVGHWSKLDQVLGLADQRSLKLILTFGDYPENSLVNLTAVENAAAAHYRGRSTIFAFDLKNEPHFMDLALATYPTGTYVALQDATIVPALGQTVARADVAKYRASGDGQTRIPKRLSDDQAFVYANVLAAYLRLLDQANTWASAHHATVVDYLAAPDSASFAALKGALNDTYATWLKPQLDAIRRVDSARLITVGQVDPYIASLPANNWLDYRTLHRYPTASATGIADALKLFDAVKATLPAKPLVLGEFGFSNATLGDQQSADLEAQVVQAVLDHGGAGTLKWMVNDFPLGQSARESNFGMFLGDGEAKPIVAKFQSLGALRPAIAALPARPTDYALSTGHFFTQASGLASGRDPSGFALTDADGITFWHAFRQLGGITAVGYPASQRFTLDGFVVQATQKVILQWRPNEHRVSLVNVFDRLHDAGQDGWLAVARQTPAPFDTAADTGLPWPTVVQRHLGFLDAYPALKARFLAEPDWLDRFGLPMAIADYPTVTVVRAQRAVLQQWKIDVPWASAGKITVANGGDVAKDAGLVPAWAMVPEPAP